jgi:hypothetical protein
VQHPGTKLSKNKMAAEGTFLRKLGKSVFQIKILRSLRYQGKISTYNFSMKIPQSKATRFKKNFISKFQPHAESKREKQDGRHGKTPETFSCSKLNLHEFYG